MNAIPPNVFADALAADGLSAKWAALHDAGQVVAVLAGAMHEPLPHAAPDFPLAMRDAGGWRLALAEQGVADLIAVMEPGIAALLAVHRRGADPAAPAVALWDEFVTARAGLIALAPERDA